MAEEEDRLAKLKVLPIFEDSAGSFGVVDETCFRTGGDFTPPQSMGDLRLIRGEACPQVLESLGVKACSRRALLEKRLLPHYEDQSPEVRLNWLRWIRDEWNRLIGEFEEGYDELVELLEDESLIQVEDSSLLPANLCYHPHQKHWVEPLLGDVAAYPDISCYKQDDKLWLEFFERLGMNQSPTPQHLADRVSNLVEQVEEKGLSPSRRASILAVARHIFSHWHQHAQTQIEVSDGTQCSFAAFLQSEPWLPAASGDELKQYQGAQEPEPRLFEFSELIPYSLGHIVASVRPLLPRDVLISRDIGISYTPPWEDVAAHFENLLDLVGGNPLSEPDLLILKKPVTEIYRFFGQHGADIADLEGIAGQANPIAKRFAGKRCILVPEERQFFLPEEVYRSGGRGLRPVVQVLNSNDHVVEKGLDILGRRIEPTAEDLSSALVRLAKDSSRPLSLEWRGAIMRCLEILAEDDDATPDAPTPEIRVLNAQGYLVHPHTVVLLDSATPEHVLEIGEEEILDPETPQKVVLKWEIPSSRRARVTPVKFSESRDSQFVLACQSIEAQLHHPEFLNGLARIIYHQNGTLRPKLEWLLGLNLQPCQFLECQHQLTLGGVIRNLGIWVEDCCYHSTDSSERMLVDEAAFHDGVLHERLAATLAELVSETGLDDLTPLVSILRCQPGAISKTLTKLRIRSLPVETSGDQAREADSSTDFFAGDESEADSEQGTDSTEGSSTQSVATPQPDARENEGSGSDPDKDDAAEEAATEDQDDGEDDQDEDGDAEATGAQTRGSGGTSSASGQAGNSSRNGANVGSGGENRNGSGTRGRSGESETTVRTHRRMLPGQGEGRGDSAPARPSRSRQQDALWISRPAPPTSPNPTVPTPADPQDDEERINHSIGKAAVGLVIAYERSQDRKPQNMAHANPGYDIESKKGRVVERYIEVKGIDGEWGINGVPLSPIQLQHAQEKGDAYWLYVVENARDPETARIRMIQNPAEKIRQYRFDHGWRDAGTTARTNKLPKPEVGRRIRVFDDDGSYKEGEVTEVEASNAQVYLRVRYESWAPAKTELYDPVYMQPL